MESLKLKTKVKRNRAFKANVRNIKVDVINFAKSLSGKTDNTCEYHWFWESNDGKYKVGVGKYGKEYYLDTVRWKDGHKANNPNDMKPIIEKYGEQLVFDYSFDHIFKFFQDVSKTDEKALEILGCIMYRNAYLQDHTINNGNYTYTPSEEAIDYLNTVIPTYEGISIEAYLHYLDVIALNEDVKYDTLGYDVHSGIGRQNNMLTYAHIISIFMGVGSIAKLCSQFSRPPIGVSAIPQSVAEKAFPMLHIE